MSNVVTANIDHLDGRTDAWGLVDHYLSPVSPYLTKDGVTEICINRFDEVYVEQHGKMDRVDVCFKSEREMSRLVKQIAHALGQVCEKTDHPVLDARLQDGSRICAVMYPTAPRGTSITIRVFPKERLTANSLVKQGALTAEMLSYLRLAILARGNGLIAGGTGSGKTTILNVLSTFIPSADRVITIEDTQELKIHVENLVSLEAPRKRQKNAAASKVDMGFLITTSLRMRPSRILVGEIRDANAAMAFLRAINTGHSGSCSTIHANHPEDALVRMQTEITANGDLPYEVVKQQVRSNLHFLVHAAHTPHHGRRIIAISEIDHQHVRPLWSWNMSTASHECHAENLKNSLIVMQAAQMGIASNLIEYDYEDKTIY